MEPPGVTNDQPVVPSSKDGLTIGAYPVAGLHCTLVSGEALVGTAEIVRDRAPEMNELATSARAVVNPFTMLTVYKMRMAGNEGKRTASESFGKRNKREVNKYSKRTTRSLKTNLLETQDVDGGKVTVSQQRRGHRGQVLPFCLYR
jgi:hypothetical protein